MNIILPRFGQAYLFNGEQLDTSRHSLTAKSNDVLSRRRRPSTRADEYVRLREGMEAQFGERTTDDATIDKEIVLGSFARPRLVSALLYVVHNQQAIIEDEVRRYEQWRGSAKLNMLLELGYAEQPLEPAAFEIHAAQEIGELATRADVLVTELPLRTAAAPLGFTERAIG